MTTVTRPRSWAATEHPGVPKLLRQLAAIDVWNRSRRDREQMLRAAATSREERLYAARQVEALARTHQALVARLDLALSTDTARELDTCGPTAVLAHRHEWFVHKVANHLRELGVAVLTVVDNGADAVGAAVVEQPDLLLVEEALPIVKGEDVVTEVAAFSPLTCTAVQVADADRIGQLLDAGARTAVARQVPPADVAQQMFTLLGGRR